MREMIAPESSLDSNPKAKLLPLEKLISNPFQIRQDFDSPEAIAALEELAADITQRGVLQPILVRPAHEAGKFEIIAGERRYRAALIAALKHIPVTIENYGDQEARLISLTENLQRRELSFKEEVEFLTQLNDERTGEGLGGETDLARLIHKSRTYVAKRLKLAAFPDLVDRVDTKQISINHAYTEAVNLEQLRLPFENNPAADLATCEEKYNVFPENTIYSSDQQLPFSYEDTLERSEIQTRTVQPIIDTSFKARMVPFNRAKEALKRMEQDFDNFKEEERSLIKETLVELESELAQVRSKLYK
jgi:ParB/RepB/Spo0J family partition protein